MSNHVFSRISVYAVAIVCRFQSLIPLFICDTLTIITYSSLFRRQWAEYPEQYANYPIREPTRHDSESCSRFLCVTQIFIAYHLRWNNKFIARSGRRRGSTRSVIYQLTTKKICMIHFQISRITKVYMKNYPLA